MNVLDRIKHKSHDTQLCVMCRKTNVINIKRYYIIDQHLARHSKYNGECLSCPPTFLCSQIITPFSHSMISINHKTGLYLQPTVESVYPYSSSILEFLFNIYITWIIQTRLNMIMFSDCADEISEDIGRIYQVLFHYSINFRGKSVFFYLFNVLFLGYFKK